MNLTELGMLLGGLEWVVKWHVMLSPFKDKKTKVKLPEIMDHYYGEDLLRRDPKLLERYREIQRKILGEKRGK